MEYPITLAIIFMLGLALGVLYFKGLWLTLKRAPGARRPASLLAISFILRLGLLAGAVALISGKDPARFIACLVGIIVARSILLAGPRGADAVFPQGLGAGDRERTGSPGAK